MRDLEAKLDSHYYAASEGDFTDTEEGRAYSKDYLDNMPSDFSGLLGRFGALADTLILIEESHARQVITDDLKDHVSFMSKDNARFQITFDE